MSTDPTDATPIRGDRYERAGGLAPRLPARGADAWRRTSTRLMCRIPPPGIRHQDGQIPRLDSTVLSSTRSM